MKPAEPASEPEEDEPLGLAALVGPNGYQLGRPLSRELPTTTEVKEFALTDPTAAEQIMKSGRYQQPGHQEGGAWVVDAEDM